MSSWRAGLFDPIGPNDPADDMAYSAMLQESDDLATEAEGGNIAIFDQREYCHPASEANIGQLNLPVQMEVQVNVTHISIFPQTIINKPD